MRGSDAARHFGSSEVRGGMRIFFRNCHLKNQCFLDSGWNVMPPRALHFGFFVYAVMTMPPKKKKRRNVREDVSPGAHSYSSQQERNMAISVSFHYRFKGTAEYERTIGGHDSKFGPIAHIIERSTDLSVRRRGHLQWLSTTARK